MTCFRHCEQSAAIQAACAVVERRDYLTSSEAFRLLDQI
jgi:hypothetical protein